VHPPLTRDVNTMRCFGWLTTGARRVAALRRRRVSGRWPTDDLRLLGRRANGDPALGFLVCEAIADLPNRRLRGTPNAVACRRLGGSGWDYAAEPLPADRGVRKSELLDDAVFKRTRTVFVIADILGDQAGRLPFESDEDGLGSGRSTLGLE